MPNREVFSKEFADAVGYKVLAETLLEAALFFREHALFTMEPEQWPTWTLQWETIDQAAELLKRERHLTRP